MSCPICSQIDSDQLIIYQDKIAIAMLAQQPAAEGHVIVAPREHFAILEQIPDNVLQHLFVIANRVSTSVFEMLGAQGTNIIVNNGISAGQEVPHFYINIVPRKVDDGINLRWAPKQLTPQDMQAIAVKIKDQCDYIGRKAPKSEPVNLDKKEKELDSTTDPVMGEVDQRIKHLERIP